MPRVSREDYMDEKRFGMRSKKEEEKKAIPIDPSLAINWLLRWLLELTLKEVLKRVMQDAFRSVRRLVSSMMRRYQSTKIDEQYYSRNLYCSQVTNAPLDDIPITLAIFYYFYQRLLFMHTVYIGYGKTLNLTRAQW